MQRKNKGPNKQALSLLACIISAFALWVYVSYVENPDMTRWVTNIPVTITGETKLNEKGFAVCEVSNTKVDLKIRAKRNAFTELTSESIVATADVSNISKSGTNNINVAITFPSTTSGISIVDRKGTTISANVEEYVTQIFTIEPDIKSHPSNGYYVEAMSIENGDMNISVSGGKSEIEKIHHISTNKVDLSPVTANTIIPLSFHAVDADGRRVDSVALETETESVMFTIFKEESIAVNVPIRADNPETEFSVSPLAVTVKGPADIIDTLGSISTQSINEYNYEAGTESTLTLILPDNVTLKEDEPSKVSIVFSQVES